MIDDNLQNVYVNVNPSTIKHVAHHHGNYRYAVAFCEASGPRLVRSDGNDEELIELAKQNALAIGAGHVSMLRSVWHMALLLDADNDFLVAL